MRIRLVTLWLMLAVSAVVTGYLLLEFYRQSANAQVARAEDQAVRACRDVAENYAQLVGNPGKASASGNNIQKARLVPVVQAALAHTPGIEGGIWQAGTGSLAYAFPTYEGTGPKTDLPIAEANSIGEVNDAALRDRRPASMRQTGRSQVLIVHACPLPGPLPGATAWTMTRVFTGQGRAYNQLLAGLALLGATVVGSALWLGGILLSWSRKLGRLKRALAAHEGHPGDLPALPPTGERELDRLVDALNATGQRLAEERERASSAERLAALGRLAAGLAHEIRNPIGAMRLKAENAIAAGDDARRRSALTFILEQVGRLDGLLRDLLTMTQRKDLHLMDADLAVVVTQSVDAHHELAAAKGITLKASPISPIKAQVDPEQIRRALDNLILNALQNTPPGGCVTITAVARDGRLSLCVDDTGPGIASDLRERLFEPFVTGRADGTGLGLAIVREIARAHGGDARLVSNPDGSTFAIEVPWQKS